MKLFSKSHKLILIATFLVIATQAIINTTSVMAAPTLGSTSQNNGSIFYDDGSVGTKTWNISAGNTLPAYFASQPSTAPNTHQQSHYLLALGFGSNVPNDATITGIAVKVERKTDATSVKDADIHLIKNWAILTTNPAIAQTDGLTACPTSIDGNCWVTNETTVTYGGASDLWGSTWTPADVNSPNFGLAFSAQRMYGSNSLTPGDDGSSLKKIYIDNVSVVVYYTTEQEATAPVIASHPDVTAIATNISGINVTYTVPNTTDSIDGITPANCSPTSGSSFPIGTTTVTCTKTNTAGNSAAPTHFNVIVTDGTTPVISLNGDNPKIITVGDNYTDAGAIATDGYDGDISESIITTNNVDSSTVGNYTVTYDVSDAAGNAATTVTRTVIVAPRKITVIANNQTKVAGTIDPTLTYSIASGSLMGNDGFTGSLTRVAGEVAGIYAINRGSLGLSNNYTLSFTDSLFEITPAPVVATTTDTTPTISNNSYTPALATEVIPDTTTSEAPVATAILGTQTANNTAITATDKKTAVQKSTNIFDLTFLGVHDWLWFVLIAVIGAAFWWIIVGRRRKDDNDEQN